MALWRTGRPIQLPRSVRVDVRPLGAVMGVEHHVGGVMAARGGARS